MDRRTPELRVLALVLRVEVAFRGPANDDSKSSFPFDFFSPAGSDDCKTVSNGHSETEISIPLPQSYQLIY